MPMTIQKLYVDRRVVDFSQVSVISQRLDLTAEVVSNPQTVYDRISADDDPVNDRLGFTFTYDVDENDGWGEVEVVGAVYIRWTDAAGNFADLDVEAAVTFDFVRPTESFCSLLPPAANSAANIRYSVEASEPLVIGNKGEEFKERSVIPVRFVPMTGEIQRR